MTLGKYEFKGPIVNKPYVQYSFIPPTDKIINVFAIT